MGYQMTHFSNIELYTKYSSPTTNKKYRISSNRRPGGECIFKIGGVY